MKIILPTASACALWKEELLGQFSDGMWENARPYAHWKYWSGVEAVVGSVPRLVDAGWCPKNTYNLFALLPVVGDRMLEIGKKAHVGEGEYTMKSLRADLKAIKTAMKTAPR